MSSPSLIGSPPPVTHLEHLSPLPALNLAQQDQDPSTKEKTESTAQSIILPSLPILGNQNSSPQSSNSFSLEDVKNWIELTLKITSFIKDHFDLKQSEKIPSKKEKQNKDIDLKESSPHSVSHHSELSLDEVDKELQELRLENERFLEEITRKCEVEKKRFLDIKEKFKNKTNGN
ncbi:MAG: hypothetical protein JSS32_10220 [Verrucomicrobia bacterium]|nr:hypothetical protein [Verrucomicrobiota bacterium]